MWTTSEAEAESTVEFINRRGHDPFDDERLTKRRQIKQRRAKLQLAHQRQAELSKQRQLLDRQLDQLALDHEQALEGTQGALQVVERRLINAISQGKAVDSDDEAQRRELLQKIDDANVKLQQDLKEVRSRIPIIEKALAEVRQDAAMWPATERDLTERDVASPELWRQYTVAKDQVVWSQARVNGISEKLDHAKNMLAQNHQWEREQQGSSYAKQIAYWQNCISDHEACLDDAQLQLRHAQTESARVRQAIVDE